MRSLFDSENGYKRFLMVLALLVTMWTLLGLHNLSNGRSGQLPNKTAQKETVEFVHFSDVHYSANGHDNSRRLLKDSPILLETALKAVQKTKPDFLLFTGDSVDTPKPENFAGLFEVLRQWNTFPVYMVLGNHDVGVKPGQTKQDSIDAFRTQGGANVFPSSNTGWYSVSPASWLRLLVLDGTTDERITANGFIPDAELHWVEQQLKEAEQQNQMVILASHFPLVEPFQSKSHKINDEDAAALRSLLEGSPNVVAYFAGHYHSAKIMQKNGIYYVTSPALVEYPNAYRKVMISRDGTLSLDWSPVSRPDLREKSKSRSKYVQTALGNPKTDHSLHRGKLRFKPANPTTKKAQ